MVQPLQIEQWLRSHQVELSCPSCHQKNFSVDQQLAMTNSIDENTTRINYLFGFPLVTLICNNCAHVMFFSAKQMGVLKDK